MELPSCQYFVYLLEKGILESSISAKRKKLSGDSR